MSDQHSSFEGPSDDPEVLAALDAVEGRGVRRRSATTDVADDLVSQFEAAAGALFAAWPRGGAAPSPSPGFQARLERFVLSQIDDHADSSPLDEPARAFERPLTETRRMATSPQLENRGPSRSFGLVSAAGWLVAAGLLVFVLLDSDGRGATNGKLDPGAVRQQFDAFVASGHPLDPWESTNPELNVQGGVSWDDESNRGYMKIDGLAANDPTVEQYQLWIFRSGDPKSEPHPVDGGVFDVTNSGAVIVPIDAKLKVGRASIFAVTVEKPGGVVVSDRTRLPMLAKRAS